MAQERKVPVLRSDTNLIEQEFDSIREKFQLEMAKMEEEMSRFRSQLIASERDRLISSSSLTSSSSSTCSRSSSSSAGRQQVAAKQAQESLMKRHVEQQKSSSSSSSSTRTSIKSSIQSGLESFRNQQDAPFNLDVNSTPSGSSWLEQLNSPLIADSDDGGKILKLRFDVTPYEPEQIIVKTIDNRLQIHASREETSNNMSTYREYNREFLLPDCTNPNLITSSLSADGVLTVEAPISSNVINDH